MNYWFFFGRNLLILVEIIVIFWNICGINNIKVGIFYWCIILIVLWCWFINIICIGLNELFSVFWMIFIEGLWCCSSFILINMIIIIIGLFVIMLILVIFYLFIFWMEIIFFCMSCWRCFWIIDELFWMFCMKSLIIFFRVI